MLAHPQTETLSILLPTKAPALGLVAMSLLFNGERPALRSLSFTLSGNSA